MNEKEVNGYITDANIVMNRHYNCMMLSVSIETELGYTTFGDNYSLCSTKWSIGEKEKNNAMYVIAKYLDLFDCGKMSDMETISIKDTIGQPIRVIIRDDHTIGIGNFMRANDNLTYDLIDKIMNPKEEKE